ncbi:unnamed protein product, partial [Brenthis ino]
MKGKAPRRRLLPFAVGKIFLRWIFTKAELLLFIYRVFWYATHIHSSMNSSVDFFESLIDEDGRFAEPNCQEPAQQAQRRRVNTVQRPRPLIQGRYETNLHI